MRRWTRFTLASAVLATGVAVLAAGPMGARMAKELGLSKEQSQKLENLGFDHEKEVAELRHQVHMKKMDLRREMEKDSPDAAALDRLVEESGALQVRLQKARIHHMLEARKVFTPEQWEKVRGRFARPEGREGGPGRMGRGHHGGDPDSEGVMGRGRGPCLNPRSGLGNGPGMGPGGGPGPRAGTDPSEGPGPGPQGPPMMDDEDDEDY